MEKIAFVIWSVLWPVAVEVMGYFNSKRRNIEGKRPLSEKESSTLGGTVFFIWIFIAILLWNSGKAQVQFTRFNDLSDFNKHRVTCTAIAWTGTIIGCKLTHDNQVKGALIGGGLSLTIGAGKELIYDKMMHKGVPSFKDFGGDCLGTAVGVLAGVMCNGIAQHMRDRKEELRRAKFVNPLK